jgi:hypothetical protein
MVKKVKVLLGFPWFMEHKERLFRSISYIWVLLFGFFLFLFLFFYFTKDIFDIFVSSGW